MNENLRWLLEDKEPSIRYRTLIELLDKPKNDFEVTEAKEKVLQSKNVCRLFSRLDERGLFPHLPKFYGNFTTFNYLAALSELGLEKDDPHINEIVDWILTPGEDKREYFIQKEFQNEHAYLLDESNIGGCRQVEFLGTLVKLGFLKDKRVERLIQVFIDKCRFDGGYLCKWKKSRLPNQIPKSCYLATVPALRLFALLPEEYRKNDSYQNLLQYFTSRNMIHSKINPNEIICSLACSFYANGPSHIITLIYAMCKLGLGNISEMQELWTVVESKKDLNNRVILESTDSKKAILMEGVGTPNKYLTLYLMLCYKYSGDIIK